ncbi:cytochrome d ubiquinol oxidase subunit II [Pseudochelatococcus lubricantis]|uniref:Cytochrome d ubiquinol oxidase subunit II n=1 Tax=Pseudochelatococcus lubricantis TaxID=1538102 RepID=A0ABX0V309_9HYPH|nr:cytochrome d ubiquinol oxidase subunit II [Pseudochelatococcus lubricantis]NIJ57426.1 cytochrome d ubiquinol oxidase subunit II [Pseudochelatococcus lubricantis]
MILHELIDYPTLRVIWWVLLGVILIGFAAMDGFDLGTGILLPFVGRDDVERRIVINTVGPVWEGNQVWLILGGGAIFASWPQLYAVSFSGFYLAMFAILFALILRPVGFKYRSKLDDTRWRSAWDWALFIGGFLPSLIFGVAVGNTLAGVPFRIDDDLRIFYDGTFFGLLNPFALLCGLVSVAMLTMHGATWLALKTEGEVRARAVSYGKRAALATIALFALGGVALWLFVDGYVITSVINPAGPSNPLLKTVEREAQAWFANYGAYPWTLIAPALGFLGPLVVWALIGSKREIVTLAAGMVSAFGVIATVGVSMFPFILPSTEQPGASLTVWDASSSHQTLFIMLCISLLFLPIVLAYTAWVYSILRGKVGREEVEGGGHAY